MVICVVVVVVSCLYFIVHTCFELNIVFNVICTDLYLYLYKRARTILLCMRTHFTVMHVAVAS